MTDRHAAGDLLIEAMKRTENDLKLATSLLVKAADLLPEYPGVAPDELEDVLEIRRLSFELCEGDFTDAQASLGSASAIATYYLMTGKLSGATLNGTIVPAYEPSPPQPRFTLKMSPPKEPT